MVSLGVALEILLFLILKFDFYFYPYALLCIFDFEYLVTDMSICILKKG